MSIPRVSFGSRLLWAPTRILVSTAAIAAGYMLFRDSWNGSRQKRTDQASAIQIGTEYQDMMYRQGNYPGLPWMQDKAQRFNRFALFGPSNLFVSWKQFKMRVNSFINDGVLQNLVPLAVMAAGGFGLMTAFRRGAPTAFGKILVGLGAAALGLFTLDRFRQVYNGDAQRSFFRDFTNSKQPYI